MGKVNTPDLHQTLLAMWSTLQKSRNVLILRDVHEDEPTSLSHPTIPRAGAKRQQVKTYCWEAETLKPVGLQWLLTLVAAHWISRNWIGGLSLRSSESVISETLCPGGRHKMYPRPGRSEQQALQAGSWFIAQPLRQSMAPTPAPEENGWLWFSSRSSWTVW